MKIFILNCDKLNFFKTFKTLNEVFLFLETENIKSFDGRAFSCFGRGYEIETHEDSGVEVCKNLEYFVDSVVLCSDRAQNEYFKFFIRCIDSNQGVACELD